MSVCVPVSVFHGGRVRVCAVFHRSMEDAVSQAQQNSVAQYFIEEETHTTPPGRAEQEPSARLRQRLCEEKPSRFREERASEPGCVMEHSQSPATVLAAEMLPGASPVLHQAAPLTFYGWRRRRRRQLFVLTTSEQLLGGRHSQLVNIANYLQLRRDVS